MRPVLLSFGPFHIFGYGAAILVGALIGTRLLWLHREKMGLLDEESFWALINVGCLSGFLGGKTLFILQYGWHGAFNIANGYSVFGGFVSVPLAVAAFARWKKIPFLKLADYMFLCSFFWLAFGRIGCFLAGCCYGRPTDLPWWADRSELLALQAGHGEAANEVFRGEDVHNHHGDHGEH